MATDLFHEELLLLPTFKRSDTRIWKLAQVPLNNPRGLAFCDPGWLVGWMGRWAVVKRVGGGLLYLLLYFYFKSNKINTSL